MTAAHPQGLVAPRELTRPLTRRTVWAVLRPLGGIAILAIIVSRMGTGPFLHGLSAVSGWSLAAAAGITVVTTVCSAWRWSLVARGLGVAVPLRVATAAYYRSQFLNTVLPGGVLGDVDRAVRHGRGAGDVGRGLRAVAWERYAGQAVQLALALSVLLLLPSLVPLTVSLIVAAAVVGVFGGGLLIRALRPRGTSSWARTLRAAGNDIQVGLLARRAWPGVALASVVVVAGHLATLFLAARTAGATRTDPPIPAAGDDDAGGHGGADQHRRLGTTRGHGRMGVRSRRPECRTGRRDGHRLRRAGAGCHPAGCSADRRRLAAAPPAGWRR